MPPKKASGMPMKSLQIWRKYVVFPMLTRRGFRTVGNIPNDKKRAGSIAGTRPRLNLETEI
jgi:hypothetical protein